MAKINAATDDTFGFDCVCLIKGILWGWNGDTGKSYGGASYASNGVDDMTINTMLSLCTDVSDDFTHVEPGEILFCSKDEKGIYGHVGVYIGDGYAVESTPAWKDCVQITAVANQGENVGENNRTWLLHGKLTPFIEYCSCESYSADGKCTVCKKDFDYSKTEEEVSGVYALKSESEVFDTPYNYKDTDLEESKMLKRGVSVEPFAAYTNAFGEKWYKAIYLGGEVGFFRESNLVNIADKLLPTNLNLMTKEGGAPSSAPASSEFLSTVFACGSYNGSVSLYAVGLVQNLNGEWWYKLKSDGWIACDAVSVKKKLEETADIIKGEGIPALIPGEEYELDVTIDTDRAEIVSVDGAIYSADNSNDALYKGSLECAKSTVVIGGSELNKALKFEKLPEGDSYLLKINAKMVGYYLDGNEAKEYNYEIKKEWSFTVTYDFLFPLDNGGKVGKKYETGASPYYGIDAYPSKNDNTVYAAFGGTVYAVNDNCTHTKQEKECEHADACWNSVYVVSDDGRVCAIYGSLKKGSILVEKGQKIKDGDPIASAGVSGDSTKTRVYFEVRRDVNNKNSAVNINPVSDGGLALYRDDNYSTAKSDIISVGNYSIKVDGEYVHLVKDEKDTKGALEFTADAIDKSFELQITEEDGFYRIKSVASKSGLIFTAHKDDSSPYVEDGSEIVLSNNKGSLAQRWIFVKCEGGYLITSADTRGYSLTKEGSALVLRKTTGEANQIWTLDKGSSLCYHTFSDFETVIQAECEQDGSEKRVCSKCGFEDIRVNERLGHKFGEWYVIENDGDSPSEERKCSACEKTETRAIEINKESGNNKNTATKLVIGIASAIVALLAVSGIVIASVKKRK